VGVPPLENTPLSKQARSEILQAILDGRFEGRLPAEWELAQMLNVSRTTVRAALQGLEQEGIITRRRAIGTTINRHVAPSTLALQRLIGFDWLLREKGHAVTVDIGWRRGPVPSEVAGALEADPDEDACLTEKSYRADGVTALCIRDVVPWGLITTPRLPAELPASMFEFSRRFCAEPIDHAVVQIVSRVKRDATTTRLDIEVGEPFTQLHETHYSRTAAPVAFSVIDVDDRYIRLEVFRREQQ
jgi:GntR family transcriptional regulator